MVFWLLFIYLGRVVFCLRVCVCVPGCWELLGLELEMVWLCAGNRTRILTVELFLWSGM